MATSTPSKKKEFFHAWLNDMEKCPDLNKYVSIALDVLTFLKDLMAKNKSGCQRYADDKERLEAYENDQTNLLLQLAEFLDIVKRCAADHEISIAREESKYGPLGVPIIHVCNAGTNNETTFRIFKPLKDHAIFQLGNLKISS